MRSSPFTAVLALAFWPEQPWLNHLRPRRCRLPTNHDGSRGCARRPCRSITGEGCGFIAAQLENNMAEVLAAQRALEHSQNPNVRGFAQKMITDHNYMQSTLEPIASMHHIQLPMTLSDPHRAMLDRLGQLSGQAFDRESVNSMVNEHALEISTFNSRATGCRRCACQRLGSEHPTYALPAPWDLASSFLSACHAQDEHDGEIGFIAIACLRFERRLGRLEADWRKHRSRVHVFPVIRRSPRAALPSRDQANNRARSFPKTPRSTPCDHARNRCCPKSAAPPETRILKGCRGRPSRRCPQVERRCRDNPSDVGRSMTMGRCAIVSKSVLPPPGQPTRPQPPGRPPWKGGI